MTGTGVGGWGGCKKEKNNGKRGNEATVVVVVVSDWHMRQRDGEGAETEAQ